MSMRTLLAAVAMCAFAAVLLGAAILALAIELLPYVAIGCAIALLIRSRRRRHGTPARQQAHRQMPPRSTAVSGADRAVGVRPGLGRSTAATRDPSDRRRSHRGPAVSDRLVTEDEWAADMLHGTESSSAPPTETRSEDDIAESDSGSAEPDAHIEGVELDPIPRESDAPDIDAGAKRTAVVLGAGMVCAIGLVAAVLLTFRDAPPPPSNTSAVPVTGARSGDADDVRDALGVRSRHSLYRQRELPGRVHLGTGAHRHDQRLGLGVRAG